MRVFVTGASGFVGSAVVPMLVERGHQVVALARSDEALDKVRALGAEPLRGDLDDHDALKRGAANADGVIHLAFIHDFIDYPAAGRTDAAAIAAMGEALAASGKPLISTSGLAFLTFDGSPATEEVQRGPGDQMPRVSEQATLALLDTGVKAMVVRLPQVHGRGDHGFTPMLIDIARAKERSVYVGDGSSRWSAVARADAALVYVLALEKGRAGRTYHAVGEEGVSQRGLAETIGRGLGVPVESVSAEQAGEHFGWFSMFATMDAPASSAITQAELGWAPTGPGLIHDLENEDYFGVSSS